MKLLLCADLHFGVKSSVESNSGNKKLGDLFFDKTAESLRHMFLKHKDDIDAICILGDFFDRRVTTDNKTLQDSIEFLEEFKDFRIYIIVGNHDCYYNTTNTYNMTKMIGSIYNNVIVVPEETLVLDNVLMVNWVNDENRESILSTIDNSAEKFLFGHFDVIGANLGSGRLSEKGFDKEVFSKFDHVFTGHYHTQSTLANITYIGNPIQTKMSEHDEEKGVILLDTTTGEWVRDNYPLKLFYKVTYDELFDVEDFSEYESKVVELKVDRASPNYNIGRHETIVNNIRSVASSLSVVTINIIPKEEEEGITHVDVSDSRKLLHSEMDKYEFDDSSRLYVMELLKKSQDELGE